MNAFRLSLCTLAVAGLTSTQALAQNEPFEASIALGYVGTTGNSETDTYNLEYLMTIVQEMWDHNFKFQALGANEDGIVKAERYYLENKSDFNLDDNHYLYGKFTYRDDRFSGFDYQSSASLGYGRDLINNDTWKLEAFGGVGYRQNNLSVGGTEGETIFTLGESVDWQISDNAALTHSLTAEIGETRTITTFEVGLETNIIGDITTKIAFQARNNSDVPAGAEKTDTQTSVSLVYTF